MIFTKILPIFLQIFLSCPYVATQCVNYTSILELIPPHFSKVVHLQFHHLSQENVEMLRSQYSRLRDYYSSEGHSREVLWGPLVSVASLVAAAVNATIIVFPRNTELCEGDQVPAWATIKPEQFAVQIVDNDTLIVQENSVRYNFFYCDRQKEADYENAFEMLFSSADAIVWICLVGALILVGYTVPVIIDKEGHLQRNIGQVSLAAVAVLLTPGVAAQPDKIKHSAVFTLWMYITIIFVTYYGGSLTSEIISPTPEWRMTSLEELFEYQYWLMFHPQAMFRLGALTWMTQVMLPDLDEDNEDELGTYNLTTAQVSAINLRQMARERISMAFSEEEYFEDMITERRATVTDWEGCIWEVNAVKQYIENRGMKRTKCYIGQELTFNNPKFYVISPTSLQDVSRMSNYFQTLMEMGFYFLWMKEQAGMNSAKRVQDRLRVKGPTNIIEDVEIFHALELEGKLHNVFVLWGICVGGCALVFLEELVGKTVIGRVKGFIRRAKRRHRKRMRLKESMVPVTVIEVVPVIRDNPKIRQKIVIKKFLVSEGDAEKLPPFPGVYQYLQ